MINAIKTTFYFALFLIGFEIALLCVVAEEKQIITVDDDDFPHWRYWNGDDDSNFIWVSYFNTDQNGNIYSVKEQNSFMFDGYDFMSLPFQRKSYGLQTGVHNQFWHEIEDGIEVFTKNKSQKYKLDHRMDQFGKNHKLKYLTSISLHPNQFYVLTKTKLYLFDSQRDTVEVIQEANNTEVDSFISLHTDQKDSVWIAGSKGIIEFDISESKALKNKPFKQFLYPIENVNIVHHTNVYPNREVSMNLDAKGTHFFSLKDGNWTLLHKELSTFGWLGHDGGFWLQKKLDDSSRRLQFHTPTKIYEIKPNKYTNSAMNTIVHNKESFWISSHNGLVSFQAPVWRPEVSMPTHSPKLNDGLFHSPNESLLINQKQLIVNKNKEWQFYDLPLVSKAKNFPLFITNHFDNMENYLIFFGRDIFNYNPNTTEPVSKFMEIDDYIHTYFIDQKKKIYVSLNENEYKIASIHQGKLDVLFQYQAYNNGVNYNDFIVRNNGDIWFIFDDQLKHIINNQVHTLPDNEKSKLGKLQHILNQNNDHPIVSGELGLFEWDEHEFNRIHTKDLGYIFHYLDTGSNGLWLATHNGLYRYENGEWLENNWQEGLPDGRQYFVNQDEVGNLYVGGDMGLRRYYPAVDVDPPETYIPEEENNTSFLIQDSFRIRFDGKDRWNYTIPDRLLYSYKLNDSEWSDFQESNVVELLKLPPNQYTIYARAMDRNMNIDTTPAEFSFEVRPPWHKNPVYLTIFSIGSFLILFFAFFAYRNHMKLVKSLHQTQRTVTLLERTKNRLSEAKTRAEAEKQNAFAATKAKDGFLARMSHEIRTPLNGIIGNLELVNDHALDAKNKSFIQIARVSANALIGMIGEVLDFAKIESGKFELDLQPCNLKNLFEETLSVISLKAQEKNLQLLLSCDDELPDFVEADPVRLRQVMLNLLGNAVKFTDRGSVSASLEICSKQENQVFIRFEVKDSGSGFDSAKKESIFKEYEQDETSHKTAEGTGLGLAISKRIIDMMNGTIDCKSLQGVGSSFWFEVPLQVVNRTEWDTVRIKERNKSNEFNFKIEHPVLVIDDIATNLILAQNQIEQLTIQCDIASGGAAALKKVKTNTYSMILVDCSMPEMDGFEFTKQFRASEHSTKSRIPVIAMTAHVVSGIREQCEEAGMDDYISKPVRLDALIAIFNHWLSGTIHPEAHLVNFQALQDEFELQNLEDVYEVLEGYLEDINNRLNTIEMLILDKHVSTLQEELEQILHIAQTIHAVDLNEAIQNFRQGLNQPVEELQRQMGLIRNVYNELTDSISQRTV